jgi:hypothetical protein
MYTYIYTHINTYIYVHIYIYIYLYIYKLLEDNSEWKIIESYPGYGELDEPKGIFVSRIQGALMTKIQGVSLAELTIGADSTTTSKTGEMSEAGKRFLIGIFIYIYIYTYRITNYYIY